MKNSEIAFLKKLGKRVRKLRTAKGFSQDKVTLGAEIARGTISKIEHGLVNPKVVTLNNIAETIGVPLRILLDLD